MSPTSKKIKINGKEQVDEYMSSLQHPLKLEIEAIRNIILNANEKVQERVKWNAPSFYYKKDIAAFNLRTTDKAQLVLIFPNGLLAHDYGFLEGEYKDRRLAHFYNMTDVLNKRQEIENIINDWVTLMDAQ